MLITSLFFFSILANAATSKAKSNNLHFKVVYGDKISDFKISKTKKGGLLSFSNSEGAKKERTLSDKDMKYFMKETSSYQKGNDQSLCSERYIEFKEKEKTIVGCIGSKTKIAKQLLDMSNLLSGIIRL
jgi:hypothetical protein